MWMDDYVKMVEGTGLKSNSREMLATTRDLNLNRDELGVELKKINENLVKISENLGKIMDQTRALFAFMVFIVVLFLAINYGCK
jgi:hypothetical protein